MYVLVADSAVVAYPYGFSDLRRDNPNVSFAVPMTDEALAAWGVFPVAPVDPPAVDPATETLQESTPELLDGAWLQTWAVVAASTEEVTARTEARAAELRAQRDELLNGSDWTQVPDASSAGADQHAWAVYRQALRKLPNQPGFPWAVTWPEPPVLFAPGPQWIQFGALLASDPGVNAMVATAASAAPVLHLMLGVGLGQAAQGDSRTFAVAWSNAITAGLASPELTAHVASLGAGCDLPAEFLAQLNPAT